MVAACRGGKNRAGRLVEEKIVPSKMNLSSLRGRGGD